METWLLIVKLWTGDPTLDAVPPPVVVEASRPHPPDRAAKSDTPKFSSWEPGKIREARGYESNHGDREGE